MLCYNKTTMARLVCTLIILWTFCQQALTEVFTVGYLTTDVTPSIKKSKQARIISGAMSLAVNDVNSDPTILAGHQLNFIWSDNQADTLVGTRELTMQWKRGAVAFFGPEDSCDVEARVAAAWNLPMISYKCADHKVSDKKLYPTFARTFPPATQVTKSIISLLKKFNWYKFTMIVGSSPSSPWSSIAEKLEEFAKLHNMTINDRYDYNDPHVAETKGNPFPSIISRTYIDTRVYVFLGDHNGLMDTMANMDERGLLETGEYVVIHVNLDAYNQTGHKYKWFRRSYDRADIFRNMFASRSLLVIVTSPPSSEYYSTFHEKINLANTQPPFNFYNPFPRPKLITVYAAYLYDAVLLYARALDKVLREGFSATDGTKIINEIKGSSYMSIQGFMCYIDGNGDAEGNYTVLARQDFTDASNNTGFAFLPVGHFEIIRHGQLPAFRILDGRSIHWVTGQPPVDEPACGYRGQHCIPPKNYTKEIIGGVMGGILLIVAIVLIIIYSLRR